MALPWSLPISLEIGPISTESSVRTTAALRLGHHARRLQGRGSPGRLLSVCQLPVFLSFTKASNCNEILQVCLQSGRVGGCQAPVYSWGFSHDPVGTG